MAIANLSKPTSKLLLSSLLFFLITTHIFAAPTQPISNYKFIRAKSFVQTKNYYLLTLFAELPEVSKLLANDKTLDSLAITKVDSLFASLKNCGRDALCYTTRMKFSEAEINVVSERLTALYKPGNALAKLVENHLIPSGNYILFQQLPAAEMLVKAWQQDAMGVNFALGVYAEGNKAKYPLIDSISFNRWDPRNNAAYANSYIGLLYNTSSLIAVENKTKPTFFNPSLQAAIYFIEMNEREQAADFEPMEAGENKAAYDRVKTIKWNNYKYSVICLPGAGPDDPKMPLSAEGMLRCRLAAKLYHSGVSPFIMPSGGKVHPYKTIYCEATEMKRFLMDKLGVPAHAIIIEPHARHTTTNLRNAARLIYRYGLPFNMPGITCTTRGQSNMIGTTLPDRCQRELNMKPFKNGNRLTETEIEFYPLLEALHINPTEIMDP